MDRRALSRRGRALVLNDGRVEQTERKEQPILTAGSDIINLTLPRYVPMAVKGTLLAVWYDSQEDQCVVLCPQCHELITCGTVGIVYQEMVWSGRKCCQGCRARISFQQDPGLIGLFLDFWYRTGNFPESASWLEAVPPEQFSLWAKAIGAALEADRRRRKKFLPGREKEEQTTHPPLLP